MDSEAAREPVGRPDTRGKAGRIEGYDLARSLAVLGMVIVNFTIVMGAESGDPSWLRGFVQALEGRAAATFVVLAGVGMTLMSRRARESGDPLQFRLVRTTLLKRALFLFVVGLAYYPIWPADILRFYGVYMTIGVLLLVAPDRRLFATAGGFVVGFVVLLGLIDYEAAWDFEALEYADFWTPIGFLRNTFYNGFHPAIPWAAFLLVGLWLGRRDLRDRGLRHRVIRWSIGIAVTAELVSWGLIAVLGHGMTGDELEDVEAVFGSSPLPPAPLYMIAGGATAIAVIALCVGLADRMRDAPWLGPLVATGQLALTIYVAHVVLGMGTLEAIGRLTDQTLPFAFTSALVFVAIAIIFSTVWRKRFRRGPLEAVMRRVSG